MVLPLKENMEAVTLSDDKVCNENESSETMHTLKNILECSFCLDIPTSGPIYRCDDGHILCKDCKKDLTHCPKCKTKCMIILSDNSCLTSEKIDNEFSLKVNELHFNLFVSSY